MCVSAEAHYSSSLFSCCFMLTSGRPACFFICIIALEYNHLENVWRVLAANSELCFARLQNDSPTVQDCHWYVFCPVSPWTQRHLQLKTGYGIICAYCAEEKNNICSINDSVSHPKTVYRLSPLFAWDLLLVRRTSDCNMTKNTTVL